MELNRGEISITRIQEGFREQQFTRRSAVDLAESVIFTEESIDVPISINGEKQIITSQTAEQFHSDQIAPTTDTLRRTRKVTEVLEDSLGVDIGHTKFARAASSAGKLSSIGSVLIAANQLISASQDLQAEFNDADNLDEVPDETYADFYRSCGILIIECFLFQTPLNYQIAWRGTRFLNNRYLYHLRDLSRPLYRYLLSEVHYLIRGIGPAALRSFGHYTDYLVVATASTVEILRQAIGDEGIGSLSQRLRNIVAGFQEFVEIDYGVTTPDLSGTDLYEVYIDAGELLNQRIGVSSNPLYEI